MSHCTNCGREAHGAYSVCCNEPNTTFCIEGFCHHKETGS